MSKKEIALETSSLNCPNCRGIRIHADTEKARKDCKKVMAASPALRNQVADLRKRQQREARQIG